jgi:hypothetical protein
MSHAFAVGQSVMLVRSRLAQAQSGDYEVLGVLPDLQYRIRSEKEGHDRIAQERSLRCSLNGDIKRASNDMAIARIFEVR